MVTPVHATATLSRSSPFSASDRFGAAVGKSVVMRALFAKLEIAAKASEAILLLGESGTGKEVLAQAIHGASPRSGKPFVVFDCSVVASNLVESELFGHVRGAFTGAMTSHMGLLEQANTGTLFIDEIGDLPLDLQPKLLRSLESRKVGRVGSNEWIPFDVRIVAATHRNLKSLVAAGAFPRKASPDIPPKSLDTPAKAQEPPEAAPARDKLSEGEGLGNLLELPLLEATEVVTDQFKKQYITAKLREHGGNVSRTADAIGVSRQHLHRLIERYGLRVGEK